METLNPEQIKAWRRIIYMQLEQRKEGIGMAAFFLPDSEIIEYWRRMKRLLEEPEPQEPQKTEVKIAKRKTCSHENTISGNNGAYCLDCEKYI